MASPIGFRQSVHAAFVARDRWQHERPELRAGFWAVAIGEQQQEAIANQSHLLAQNRDETNFLRIALVAA
jgi:hypothetical protein